jgi:hypothetical protein
MYLPACYSLGSNTFERSSITKVTTAMIPSLSYLLCGQWSIAAAIATAEGHCLFSAPAAMGPLLRDLARSQPSEN